ncbi:MAG TPA: LamG domain-containing protein [Segetibacter sp.]|jgi:hypothetical protein|nr:LamG domain-containing protein [Segetibacter sp.]
MSSISKYSFLLLSIGLMVGLNACTKAEMDDDFSKGDAPPVGSYTNSSEISPENLIVHLAFEDNYNDSKNTLSEATAHGTTSFVAGKKGKAYQGSTTGFVSYSNPGAVATLTSFTVSFWLNTQKHEEGAQGVFALTKEDSSFWSNFFAIIEGNNTSSNRMLLKFHFEKNVIPPIPNMENWVDPPAELRPDDMYGAWRHVCYTYDEATSILTWYVNGQKLDLPADITERKSGNGTEGLGPLAFKDAKKFVIGGFQNHLGAPYNGLEPWMLNYTGMLDEFKIYNKAITSQEANALYQLERQGR